jgi:peptide/nickel transport system ATP-binding protein
MRGEALDPIAGSPPDLADLPSGCSFAPRCSAAREVCLNEIPRLFASGAGQAARCLQYQPGLRFDATPTLKAS